MDAETEHRFAEVLDGHVCTAAVALQRAIEERENGSYIGIDQDTSVLLDAVGHFIFKREMKKMGET